MAFEQANQYLQTKGIPASTFEEVGTIRSGYLMDAESVIMKDPKTQEIKYRKGTEVPQLQLVITWKSDEIDPSNPADEGVRKLYLSWRAEKALTTVLRANKWVLEENAWLSIAFVGEEKVPGQLGKAKLYEVDYKPAEKKLSQPSEQWADETPVGATETPFSEAGTAASTPSEANVKLALKLWDNGKGSDIDLISQATGIPVDVLRKDILSA